MNSKKVTVGGVTKNVIQGLLIVCLGVGINIAFVLFQKPHDLPQWIMIIDNVDIWLKILGVLAALLVVSIFALWYRKRKEAFKKFSVFSEVAFFAFFSGIISQIIIYFFQYDFLSVTWALILFCSIVFFIIMFFLVKAFF